MKQNRPGLPAIVKIRSNKGLLSRSHCQGLSLSGKTRWVSRGHLTWCLWLSKGQGLPAPLEFARFLPLNPLSRQVSINNRNHRKIVVIDGTTGFTGSMNIGDLYAGLA
ncbi:MAG: hypothetical protein KAT93_03795, partial [Desulfuromonadales bacterium]|nr:hypothetical protein [Desulfuromonadales bacterium]